MSTYYLRIEAVNFDTFLGDTHDLSTVRGGGLLLLEAVEQDLAHRASGGAHSVEDLRLQKIYSGASIGLFSFDAADSAAAEKCRERVEAHLHQGALSEATLMVDLVPEGQSSVKHLLAALMTRNRRRQLTSPTLVMPAPVGDQVCEVNDLHPAVQWVDRKGASAVPANQKKIQVSSKVLDRREYGVEQKYHFYKRTGTLHEEYVNELDQLTDCPGQGLLHHKLALIYLDGNDFGKIVRDCNTVGRIQQFSELLQGNQNAFLRHVLDQALADPSWLWSGNVITNGGQHLRKERAIRLDTLLWGGDEIIWVVPAWKGWWMLAEFFRTFGHVDGKPVGVSFAPKPKDERALTHGASIVFAHHHAPIHRLTNLAKHLAEAPKKRGKKDTPTTNWFTYQVLESFDHLGSDPDVSREARLPFGVKPNALCLPGDQMHLVPAALEPFRQRFPKAKLHALTRGGPRERKTVDVKAAGDALKKYGLTHEFATFRKLLQSPSDEAAWFHLAELWDYTRTTEEAAQ